MNSYLVHVNEIHQPYPFEFGKPIDIRNKWDFQIHGGADSSETIKLLFRDILMEIGRQDLFREAFGESELGGFSESTICEFPKMVQRPSGFCMGVNTQSKEEPYELMEYEITIRQSPSVESSLRFG